MKKIKRAKSKRENKWDKYFLLSWKKLLMIIVGWFVSVVLHNLVYMIIMYFNPSFTGDEAFFFIIAIIVIPLYFILTVLYSVYKFINKK
jgi:Na+/melibiose symporter-like transporter